MKFDSFTLAIEKVFKHSLNNNQKQQFNNYYQKLIENNRMNLFGFSNQDLWLKYFYHSVFVYRNVDFSKLKTCLDLGSGSGIPGIVLKIIFPHLHLTIVEANSKKATFMTNLVKNLNLDNVVIKTSRIEDIKPSKVNQFDFATARAVAPLEQLLELTAPYVKVGGLLVLPKSKNYLQEIKDLNKELEILGCELTNVEHQIDHDYTFCTLYIKKISKTPDVFPRKYQQIVKGFNYGNKSK